MLLNPLCQKWMKLLPWIKVLSKLFLKMGYVLSCSVCLTMRLPGSAFQCEKLTCLPSVWLQKHQTLWIILVYFCSSMGTDRIFSVGPIEVYDKLQPLHCFINKRYIGLIIDVTWFSHLQCSYVRYHRPLLQYHVDCLENLTVKYFSAERSHSTVIIIIVDGCGSAK